MKDKLLVEGMDLLAGPFTIDALAHTVRSLLEH